MKKAFDQTVRDLKREVNKKVLKVPSIEQKVLDATSNEPWGPHGTLLADIAQASRNYNEYQMIMGVMWKRINDTGKNWRHVYKALTTLEYLVAHGSERVIDEIREHAYQIQTLSDFQYIDSTGRDQGSNVRKKSQSLVMLVNDKERVHEVRQKAANNRDKFGTTSVGNMYRPGSYASSVGYGDRDEERNGYGREREYGYRDDDRYGRYGEPYGRDGDRYGRGSEPYSRDDDSRGRSRSVDKYEYGSRSRSSDRTRDRTYEDDGQYTSSSAGRRLERKYSEQNLGAPPSYEEVGGPARSPTHSVRDGETSPGTAPKPSSPPASASPTHTAAPPPASASPTQATSTAALPPVPRSPPVPVAVNSEPDSFDEFDPRGSFSAAPTTSSAAAPITSGSAEFDLLGSLSEAFTSNSLALVPVTPVEADSEVDTSISSASGPTYVAATSASFVSNQTFDDPFGDGPFKAIPSTNDLPGERQSSNVQHPTPNMHSPQELSNSDQNIDILADILPPTGPQQHLVDQPASVTGFPTQSGQSFPAQSHQPVSQGFHAQGQPSFMTGFPTQMAQHHPPVSGFPSHKGPFSQTGIQTLPSGQPAQTNTVSYGNYDQQMVPHASNILSRSGSGVPVASQTALPAAQLTSGAAFMASQSAPSAFTGSLAKDKFETKSTVWADTLSRGLVNLDISGSKTNSMSDIGIDFDALNRKEKRMEKPSTTPVISTITMGKAMGSGSGMGHAGAGSLRPPSNSMMGAGMGMGMGMGGGPRPGGMGMGSYAGMHQQMGMNMQANMGMQMGMNMGVGGQMQQPTGFPPGSNIRGGYNPMMGGAPSHGQQPYGGGYR